MPEAFDSEEFAGLSESRRAFLKKLVVGSAFAVPVVASFTMGRGDAAVGPGVRPWWRFGFGGNMGGGSDGVVAH